MSKNFMSYIISTHNTNRLSCIIDQDDCALNNGGCSHGCVQGPYGAQCTCPSGFQLLNDSKTCDDIDECLILGFCSQQCYNERGSFRCYCSDGYLLEPDGRTCKATGELHTFHSNFQLCFDPENP